MNAIIKIIVAIFGAINTVFSIAMPLFVALLMITTNYFSPINQNIILVLGIMSSVYRSVTYWKFLME